MRFINSSQREVFRLLREREARATNALRRVPSRVGFAPAFRVLVVQYGNRQDYTIGGGTHSFFGLFNAAGFVSSVPTTTPATANETSIFVDNLCYAVDRDSGEKVWLASKLVWQSPGGPVNVTPPGGVRIPLGVEVLAISSYQVTVGAGPATAPVWVPYIIGA